MATQGTRRHPRPARALRWRIPGYLAGDPHPARAFGAPPPPPPRGRGQCVAISGKQPYPGCSRWAAVPGSSPGYPHVLDRGDIATGGRADGEGACPLPCLPRSNHLTPRHPHPARACGAPPPPPSGGRGQCPGVYQVSSRIRGVAGGQPCPALLLDIPMCWTVGYRHGGRGRRGGGTRSPSPVSHAPTTLLLVDPGSAGFSARIPVHISDTPAPGRGHYLAVAHGKPY